MSVSPRLIRRRIKSIGNTRKITKAMELVAASKMKRAVQMTLSSRAYAQTATEIAESIMRIVDPSLHPMLVGKRGDDASPRGKKLRTLVIACASDRGLCGGFNAQTIKSLYEFLLTRPDDEISVIAVGRRAARAIARTNHKMTATFEALSNTPSFAAAKPVGMLAVQQFLNGEVDRVFVAYMDYKSALRQIPTISQVLPIIPEHDIERAMRTEISEGASILFEPDPSRVLEDLLPKLIETRIYQALLESAASEHSARMMAMRSATDNANSMLEDLTLTYNQARQAGITQEISEISAGKAAIE
jgi:F-type H+-transporting ATPase subunit gamma